jgi:hypothetical protein
VNFGIRQRLELLAAKAYYYDLINKDKSEDEAISMVLKQAKDAGFDLREKEVLSFEPSNY